MIDRLPPQSLEAEQSVLGAMLIDRDAVIEVAEFLRPADFYRQANGRIYAAVLELYEWSAGNLFGTTRTVQLGLLGSTGCGR